MGLPHLKDEAVISHHKETIQDVQPSLDEDTLPDVYTLPDVCTHITRAICTISYRVGHKHVLPTQAKLVSQSIFYQLKLS